MPPAGTINLRTRRVDRKGQRFNYTVASSATNTNTRCARRRAMRSHACQVAPDVHLRLLEFYFNNKLGVSINGRPPAFSRSSFATGNDLRLHSAQALAAGHPLGHRINFKDGPKVTTKYSGGLKLDYQP